MAKRTKKSHKRAHAMQNLVSPAETRREQGAHRISTFFARKKKWGTQEICNKLGLILSVSYLTHTSRARRVSPQDFTCEKSPSITHCYINPRGVLVREQQGERQWGDAILYLREFFPVGVGVILSTGCHIDSEAPLGGAGIPHNAPRHNKKQWPPWKSNW